MNIDEIIPYEGNARHNERAIPEVAKSIEDFGFKGAIVLRSKDDPTIVNGHTRVAACKLLGWTEFPDEHIVFADDLTDDEVRALRLADNRTGEIATWNKALLKREVKALDRSKFDMSRYGFDFKSKKLPYGAERLKTDEAYNLDIVNIDDCGPDGVPQLARVDARPDHMIGFNYAKTSDDHGACVHFFVDDYQFERLWRSPANYLDVLGKFKHVCSPDFSMYMDMPTPVKRWNHYRNMALAHYWDVNGISVIPTLLWAGDDTLDWCFGGYPQGGTFAVSTVGVKRSEKGRAVWFAGMDKAIETLYPDRILLFGGGIGYDFGGIEVVEYENSVTERMKSAG